MTGPRTTREALVAEILGDVDVLLARVERVTEEIRAAERQVGATAATLNEAGDKYRLAITAFTDQAKTELTQFLQRKAGEVASKTVDEQRSAIQEAARHAFKSEASDKATALGLALGQAAREFRRSRLSWFAELTLAALLGSCLTAGAVILALR
jgi:hypothetical protein